MQVGLNEAARLAGKDQSTITRACQGGRLSFTKDESGNRMFDLAELERVYGPLRKPEGQTDPAPTADIAAITEALERAHAAEVTGLQREIRRLEDQVRLIETQCSQWQGQASQITRLLTDQREQAEGRRGRNGMTAGASRSLSRERWHSASSSFSAGKPHEMSKLTRRLLDAAHAIHLDAPEEITFQHSVLTQCALPHRAPPDDARVWQRRQGRTVLHVQTGAAYHPRTGAFVEIGLPYGPRARMILMHLNSEAVKARSPVVEVETSLTAFVRRVQGRPPTGPELAVFKDQLSRLAAATIRLAVDYDEGKAVQVDTKIVGGMELWFEKDERQRVLWPATIRLSLDYYESLSRHAVPLDERAIAALAHSAMALDVYCWLAQRLHRVPAAGQQISWQALHDQFGQGFARVRKFREFFLKQLRQVQRRLSCRPAGRGAGRV